MDWYEQQRLEGEKRAADKKHKQEIADAEYEQERAAQATRRAEQEAEQARRYSQTLRREAEEERESYAWELERRADDVKRLEAEKATIVTALRNLVAVWTEPAHLKDFQEGKRVPPLAFTEAQELLRLIDLADAAQ